MKRKTDPVSYLFLLPHAVFFSAFVIFPIFNIINISLHEWGVSEGKLGFTGWKNYLRLFDFEYVRSQQFWMSLGVTLQFMLITIPLYIVVGLFLALALNSKLLKGKSTHLSAIFLPTALAATIIATLWRMIFNDTGIVNAVLMLTGHEKMGWLSNLPWVWVTLVVSTLWWTIGLNVIIFLGGLQKIPDSLYDAAKIDGAGWWSTFRVVTLPGINDVLMYVLITQAVSSFGLFAQPQLMTLGMPSRRTISVLLNIYGTAFGSSRPLLGLSSAMSVMASFVVMAATLAQFLTFSRETREARR